ncbi:hypothetical protein [Verrucosispora sp. WMMC514]|nr:hypothetical protein [Verrucosispora sp. WMMC514]WBB94124.1 hypothetical protein O7597_14845 [Verrucosispora sp. WMMC514]
MAKSESKSGHTTDPRLESKSYGDLSPSKATKAAAENARQAGRNT